MLPNRVHAEQPSRLKAAHVDATSAAVVLNLPDVADAGHELLFQSLLDEGRGYAFPCNAGRVNLEVLDERARNNYFYVRTPVGCDLSLPAVHARHCNEKRLMTVPCADGRYPRAGELLSMTAKEASMFGTSSAAHAPLRSA